MSGKTYAHVYQFMATGRAEMQYYIRENKNEIKRINYAKMEIICSNGDIHVFMNEGWYKRWCLGRDYYMCGDHYRSGHKLKEGEQMNGIITESTITESERFKLNEAAQIMIQITDRMEREGKKLVYENIEKKIRAEYNTRMMKLFTQALYEISKGVAE